MNNPPTRPGPEEPHSDDPSIPVLTDRLGLPPLEFDTTLPMFESTTQTLVPDMQILTALPGAPPPPPPLTAEFGQRAPAPMPSAPPAPAMSAAPDHTPAPADATSSAFNPSFAPAVPARAKPGAEAEENVRIIGDTIGNPLAAAQSPSDGRHWARIEMELRTSILREIAVQLPREVEAIVQKRMSGTIEKLLASLASETRMAVAASLREIVERAVHAELERLRNSNRG